MSFLHMASRMQDKNKYNSPKYRLAVRFTNKFILAQVIYATIQGDVVSMAFVAGWPSEAWSISFFP